MARRKKGSRKPAPVRVARVNPDVEQLLDGIEEAIVGGDRARVTSLLEQLWPVRSQVGEALTRRIISGRARIPAFAFEILGSFAGQRTPTYLRRIAQEPSVLDIVRFGAQRRAGWPTRGEAKRRREFLATLRDPEGTLIVALDQATDEWPPDGQILEEVLGYLIALPVEPRHAAIERAVRELGARVSWLLHALLHVGDPATQRLALGQLVRSRAPGAAGPIGRLARTARDAALREEAAAAARRLALQVVDRGPSAGPRPLPPLDRALLSMIDGDGGQVILVVRRWESGVFLVADIFHNDGWGIKGSYGSSQATPDVAEGMAADLEEAGVHLVEVDLAAVRGALAQAVEANAATGHGIPPAFEIWEPLVHEAYPPPADEPIAMPELDDAPYAGRQDLVRAGGELAEHPFFESWGFEVPRLMAAMLGVPPPTRGRLTERQYRPLIEHLVDPPRRALLRQRLRRQAWLLEQDGDLRERDLALATAAQLGEAGPADLTRQPFLRELIDHSLAELVSTVLPPFGPLDFDDDPYD